MQNILILELDRFKILEKIMISLKRGVLPKALVGVEKLKSILASIKVNLKNNYDLAIEDENWAYYYDFPLVSHIVTRENNSHYINLHMKVPLRQKDKLSKYKLITPHFQAFPCLGNCFDKYPDKEQLLVLKYPQHSWLYNPISREVDFEVNQDHMSCKETHNKRLCYTFYTSLLSASTKCTEGIIKWDENTITKWCNFRFGHRTEYRVIPIDKYRYIIHNKLVPVYFESCTFHVTKVIGTDKGVFSQVIEVKQGCNILVPFTMQKLIAPYSEIEREQEYMELITYHSSLMDKLRERFENKSNYLPIPEFLGLNESFINETAWRSLEEELDNNKLTKLFRENTEILGVLNSKLNRIGKTIKTFNYRSTFWGYLSVAGHLIQVSIVLYFIFIKILRNNFFGLFSTILVVVEPPGTNAWQLLPDIQIIPDVKLFPTFTMDVFEDTIAMKYFIDSGLVVCVITLIILSILFPVFRKIKISTHYGSFLFGKTNTDWSLMLNIRFEEDKIGYRKIENIHIRIPLVDYFEGIHFHVDVKNTLNTWTVKMRENRKGIYLCEGIHLYGLNSGGERMTNRSIKIFIPLKDITWTSASKPTAFNILNNFDFAIVTVIKNSKQNTMLSQETERTTFL